MFRRQGKKTVAPSTRSMKDLMKILPVRQLLADEKRQNLLAEMKSLSGLEESRYESLCVVLINNLIQYCQSLPETSHHYYSQPGGIIDHALNRTEAALSLFSQFVVLDENAELSEQQKLWQYALYSAALLKGIGKLFVDFSVNLYDNHGYLLKSWNPLLENLTTFGKYYDYSFEKEPDIEFRRRLNLLLARAIVPASGFAWIASDVDVLTVWLALLNEDERSAGTLGAILIRADAIAIQRYFNRLMVKGFGGRTGRYGRIGAFSDSTPASITEKEQQIGIEFIQWLARALEKGQIQLNKTPLFMVPGGMLMSADVFKWFVRENPEFKNWQAVQNGFLSLGLHEKGPDGKPTTSFEQINNQQIHSGVVFEKYGVALPEKLQVHNMNTGKSVNRSAVEVIHSTELANHFVRAHSSSPQASVQQLSSSGQWKKPEVTQAAIHPGVKRSG
ncbi:TraI domain-containing protein [Legionella israelensis]|nr:TraI domain-containing protein [Legionella israelensis]